MHLSPRSTAHHALLASHTPKLHTTVYPNTPPNTPPKKKKKRHSIFRVQHGLVFDVQRALGVRSGVMDMDMDKDGDMKRDLDVAVGGDEDFVHGSVRRQPLDRLVTSQHTRSRHRPFPSRHSIAWSRHRVAWSRHRGVWSPEPLAERALTLRSFRWPGKPAVQQQQKKKTRSAQKKNAIVLIAFFFVVLRHELY